MSESNVDRVEVTHIRDRFGEPISHYHLQAKHGGHVSTMLNTGDVLTIIGRNNEWLQVYKNNDNPAKSIFWVDSSEFTYRSYQGD